MYNRILPGQHPDIASCLGYIGHIYKKKGDFKVALNYYHQQLKMEEQCLPLDHSNLSTHLDSIVDTYKMMGEIKKGFEFCQEKQIS
jgi:tetratricopeptide (TPR) repeat protein